MTVMITLANLSLCSELFFFFKQKTAYEMRISDWSSDVCSSDLTGSAGVRAGWSHHLQKAWRMTVRALVVDDSPTMRALLSASLSRDPDIEVVGAASNAMEGRQLIKELDPDVITLDIAMPGMSGLDFLEKTMTLRPPPAMEIG